MVSSRANASVSVYLTTRTRDEFEQDSKAYLSEVSMPIAIVAEALGGGSSDAGRMPMPDVSDIGQENIKAPSEAAARRAVKSRNVYPWYRRVSGRSYQVFNLDTRNPAEFNRAAKVLGQSLSTKT